MVPAADMFGQQIATMLDHYLEAGGKTPRLLLADETHGAQVIEMMARFYSGLPADMLPMTMHSVGRVGHDLLVTAVAQGYEQVVVTSTRQRRTKPRTSMPRSLFRAR